MTTPMNKSSGEHRADRKANTAIDDWTPFHEQAINELLGEWLSSPADADPILRQTAMEFDALPLFLDMWSWWFLGSDGRVIVRDVEGGTGKTAIYTDHLKRLSATTGGTRRFPQLRLLLPQRPCEAVDCLCTEIALMDHKICGTCGGLGWLLPNDVSIRKVDRRIEKKNRVKAQLPDRIGSASFAILAALRQLLEAVQFIS